MLCKTRLNTEEARKLPPKYVIHILKTLEGAGYHAVLAGGCVRDTILGRRPNDWDIATSAPPDAVQRLFARTVPTGIRHGTVTVLYGGGKCEVTTWRVEGAYSDHRRPDSVEFTPSLAEDLARRDFTINAMAMDVRGELTDPFGGRADLERGIIRCVGEPRARFAEDALRMLRAVRFAAKLGFELDGATLAAALECAPPSAPRTRYAACSRRRAATTSGRSLTGASSPATCAPALPVRGARSQGCRSAPGSRTGARSWSAAGILCRPANSSRACDLTGAR